MLRDIPTVLARLQWMREQHLWPNGPRYLWTDAFGVLLLDSLFRELGNERYLREAEWVVAEVERVLGRPLGIRIGEAPDRDGQYFHYLAMWLYALGRLGEHMPRYRERALRLARDIHPRFVVPGEGVHWKMVEDLSGPSPGYGFGALDAFHGYVVYRQLGETELAREIADLRELIELRRRPPRIAQDLGLGMMLWMTHFYPHEAWALRQRRESLEELAALWTDPPGYFCRGPGLRGVRYAFTNYGVCLGLQAVNAWPARVLRLQDFFATYRSGDAYDTDPITHVMGCVSHLPGVLLSDARRAELPPAPHPHPLG